MSGSYEEKYDDGTGFDAISSSNITSYKNPFQLPADEEVFSMREVERQRKLEERERNKKLKIWEKTTGASKMSSIRPIRTTFKKVEQESLKGEKAKSSVGVAQAASAALKGSEWRAKTEKENMTEFIAKKREMFLVQMSLDTKREEIRKLEEKAQMKEEALRKSELMLEEDAIRFDAFLKDNDQKAHNAIKEAETETK